MPESDEEMETDASPAESRERRGRRKGDCSHPVHKIFSYHETTNQSHCIVSGCTTKVPGRHAGNLMSHLRRRHKEIHATVLKEHTKTGQAPAPKRSKTTVLNGVHMSAEALELHATRLVTEHGLSFKSLDYAAFQDIIRPMLNAMPASERPTITSNTIRPKIHGFAARVRAKLIAQMEGKMMSLQVDSSTKHYRHFIGVNVQYVYQGRTVVRTLAVEQLFTRSTSVMLKGVITQILKKYKIEVKQLVSFTSDNGANYILAGKMLTTDDTHLRDLADDGTDAEEELPDVELTQDTFTIQSIRCAAHTLQLAISDALNNDKSLKPLLQAVRQLINFLRNEVQAVQFSSAGVPLPVLDVVTRWCSLYDMLQSILRCKNFIELTLECSIQDRAKHFLTDEQWTQMTTLLDDLEPVYQATKQLQAEALTLGEFYAVWMEAFMALKKRTSALCQNIAKGMEERSKSLQYKERGRGRTGERLPPLFHYPGFHAAVFLDPRYFAILTSEQIADAKQYLVDLWQRMQVLRGPPENAVEEDEDEVDEDDPSAEECSDFAQFLASKNQERKRITASSGRVLPSARSNRQTIRALLDNFDRSMDPLPVTTNIILWWESKKLLMPELYELALIVLAIPATQVSVERLFSALRFILRPQRFSMSAEQVDDCMFLHANAELVQELARECLELKNKTPSTHALEPEDREQRPVSSASSSSASAACSFSSSEHLDAA